MIAAAYACLAVRSLASPCGYWFRSIEQLVPVALPWGETVHIPRGPISWGYVLSEALQYTLYARLLLHAPQMYRDGRRADAWLWGGATVLLLTAVFHDQGIDLGWWRGWYVGEWVFLAMLLVMGGRLAVGAGAEHKERLLAAQALSQSEARLRHIVEATVEGIGFTEGGRVVDVNRQLAAMLSYTPADLIVPAGAREDLARAWAELLQQTGGTRLTQENVAKDGRVVLCDWFNTALVDGFGQVVGAASLVLDITEHRRLEAQLQQAQKMEAVGQLAGGLAHDFNNMLQAILGHLLISDVVLPDMTGRELAQRLRIARPETKLLFVSGYASEIIGRHGILDGEFEFLQKPFTREALAVKIQQALARP